MSIPAIHPSVRNRELPFPTDRDRLLDKDGNSDISFRDGWFDEFEPHCSRRTTPPPMNRWLPLLDKGGEFFLVNP